MAAFLTLKRRLAGIGGCISTLLRVVRVLVLLVVVCIVAVRIVLIAGRISA